MIATANRLRSELAVCRLPAAHDIQKKHYHRHIGADTRVFSAQVEVADELTIIPTYSIAFSGCDLRCAFCITGRESWNPRAGLPFDAINLATRATAAVTSGTARTVMILGGEPSLHLPAVLSFVAHLPDDIPLIWKTNGCASSDARACLDHLFDAWVIDYKFGNDTCATRLAKAPPRYNATLRETLLQCRPRDSTAAIPPLIVRHLLMPGHTDCCWLPIARWLATHLPEAPISLRTGFWPAWKSCLHPELNRTCNLDEIARAHDIAAEYQLTLIE